MQSNEANTVWDPFLGSIDEQILKNRPSKLQKKLDRYSKNPNLPFRNLLLLAIPGILGLGLMIFGANFITKPLGIEPQMAIFIVFMLFMPMFFYYGYIHNLQRDLVKLLVADKKNWLYSPNESANRWYLATEKFPNFFNKGNQNQRLEDEFWGSFGKTNFYQSLFHYGVKTQSKRDNKTRYYFKTVFAIELPKNLKSEFRLMPPKTKTSFSFFRRPETISTESYEFNKYFEVFYNGKSGDEALNVIKTLSPALIEKLIKLRQDEGRAHVYFQGTTVLFMLEGRLLPNMKTNFFRRVELDPRDRDFIEERVEKLLKISQEMIKYLD